MIEGTTVRCSEIGRVSGSVGDTRGEGQQTHLIMPGKIDAKNTPAPPYSRVAK